MVVMGVSGLDFSASSIFSFFLNPQFPWNAALQPARDCRRTDRVFSDGRAPALNPAASPNRGLSKDRLQMAVKKILRDIPADDLLIFFQRAGEPLAHPGRDLEADMQKLS